MAETGAGPGREKVAAIVGASRRRSKFGNKSVRAHVAAGWRVVPVNLKGGEIEGLPVARSLGEIGEPVARISVYLPPAKTMALLPEIAAMGAREVWFNPGTADDRVLAAARDMGIPAIDDCSIVDLGLSPSDFP